MSRTRRGILALAAAVIAGKGVAEAADEVDVDVPDLGPSEENRNPLDATDIEITDTDVETFLYAEGDWDARAIVEGANTGDRAYAVVVEAALMDEANHQIGPLKQFKERVEPGRAFEVTKKWQSTSSIERDGDHLRINWVEVSDGNLFLSRSDRDIYDEDDQLDGDGS